MILLRCDSARWPATIVRQRPRPLMTQPRTPIVRIWRGILDRRGFSGRYLRKKYTAGCARPVGAIWSCKAYCEAAVSWRNRAERSTTATRSTRGGVEEADGFSSWQYVFNLNRGPTGPRSSIGDLASLEVLFCSWFPSLARGEFARAFSTGAPRLRGLSIRLSCLPCRGRQTPRLISWSRSLLRCAVHSPNRRRHNPHAIVPSRRRRASRAPGCMSWRLPRMVGAPLLRRWRTRDRR